MKNEILLIFAIAIFNSASGQRASETDKDRAIQEIKALLSDLNEAIKKHDKEQLEKIYANEFLFIHGMGFIDTKTEHINSILETDSTASIPLPSFDQFQLYGDVAVLRVMSKNPIAGNNLMTTTIYAKRNNVWNIVQVQSTQQQKARDSVVVVVALLDKYSGKYMHRNGSQIEVSHQGGTFFAQRKGRPKLHLIATSNTQFFDKFGTSYTFDGVNNGLTLRAQNGQETIWKKSQ